MMKMMMKFHSAASGRALRLGSGVWRMRAGTLAPRCLGAGVAKSLCSQFASAFLGGRHKLLEKVVLMAARRERA